jgi:hypothetical protein
MKDPIIQRLESLGQTNAPYLSEAQTRAIEERVLAAGPAIIEEPNVRRRAVPMLVSVAAVLLIAVVAFAALSGGRNGLTVSAAEGVMLELPDGSSTAVSAGDDVPDGAIVEVAVDGEVVVDGQRFGSGRYLVVDGRLRPEPITWATSTTTTNPRSTSTTSPTVTRVLVADPPSSTTTDRTTTPPDGTRDRPITTADRTTIVNQTTVPRTTTTTIRERPDRTSTTTVPPTTTAAITVPSDRPFDTRPPGG